MKRLLTWDIEKDMASAILQKDQAKQRLDKKAKPDNQKKDFKQIENHAISKKIWFTKVHLPVF